MSSPTPPGSDPNHPQGQPGWNAPQGPPPQGYGSPEQAYGSPPQGYGSPQQGYGGPAPAYSGAPDTGSGQKPGMVTAAAVIGIVIGALGALSLIGVGVLFAFDAVLGLIGLLAVAAAVVTLIGGIQAIQGKSPRLLLLGSYASIGVQLLQFIWGLVTGYGFLFFGFLGLILPGVIVFLLLNPQSKQYYASRGISY